MEVVCIKKIIALLLTLVCLATLVTCNTNDEKGQPYFIGKVIEVYEESCLLEVTNNGNQHLASGDVATPILKTVLHMQLEIF